MDRSFYSAAALGEDELDAFRHLARENGSFEVRAARSSRLVHLSASLQGARLDLDASLGVRIAEASALLALAGVPVEFCKQHRIKLEILRSWRADSPGEHNLAVMLAAAVAADRERLVAAQRGMRAEDRDGR